MKAPDGSGPAAVSHAPAVLRGAALQVIGHAFAIGLTAAATIVLTRFLGVDGYGRFTVLTVFLMIGVSVSELGLNATAIRRFASGDPPEAIFSDLIGLRLVLSSCAALTAILVFAILPHEATPLGAALLTSAAMILAGVNLTVPTAMQARLDFRLGVGLDLTARAAAFGAYAVGAVAITSTKPDARLLLATLGLALGYLVALTLGLVTVRRLGFPVLPTFHGSTWASLLRDAFPLGVVMILGLASYRIDALVLAALKGPYDVGIYGLAYRFMEAAVPIGSFVSAAVFPLLVREERDRTRRGRQVARAIDLMLVVSVAVAIGTFVLAPDLVRLLGGSAYDASVLPLRILVLSLPFTFVSMLLQWAVIAQRMQARLIPIVLLGLALNLAGNLALIPSYSYKASASVTLAVEILGAVIIVVAVRRWLAVGPSLSSSLRIVVAGALALGLGLALVGVAGDAAATAATLAAFAAAILVLGVVTRNELRALVRPH